MDNTNQLAYEKLKARQELSAAVAGANDVLASATTIFPFTLFPDTVTVDREKISVTKRFFFRVAEVVSMRIEDALSVTADVGPFMGSLKISNRFFNPDRPHNINFLWRHDALRIKRILQGYIIALHNKIDCSALTTPELRGMLDKLGQSAPGDEA